MSCEKESFRWGMVAGRVLIPTFTAIFFGFGVAAMAIDMPPVAAMAMSVVVFAGPAQFAMLDAASGGATATQLALVGIAANLRFFVMSISLAHFFKSTPLRRIIPWAHMVAASPFLLTFFQSRKENPGNLFGYYKGATTVGVPAIFVGTALGVAVGSGMPPPIAFGATLFMPVYFSILLAGDLKGKSEFLAVAGGAIFTPPLEALLPGWGLLIAAIATSAAVCGGEKC